MATTASRRPRARGAGSRSKRPCSLCRTPAGAFHAIPIGEAWVCAACFHREAAPGSVQDAEAGAAPPPPGDAQNAAATPTACPGSSLVGQARQSATLARIHRIDRAQQLLAFWLRTAAYVGLWIWSLRSATGAAVFTGFLLADTLTWLAATAVDIRFHRLAAGADLVLYMGVALVWLSLDRTWTLPDDPSLRACAWLMFALVAFVKLGFTVQRYVISDPD